MDLPAQPAPLIIRRGTPADREALGRLGALLVSRHHELDPERFIAPTGDTAAGYAGYLGTQLKARDAFVFVAERDGAVLGYTFAALEGQDWMSLRGPAGVVHDIVVDAGARRGGIGRALLEATIAALEKAGAPRVVLSTAARNEPAQRLFARAGFRQTMIEMTRERGGDPS